MTDDPAHHPVVIAILAAGGSRRLGTPKQLVRFGGQSLLAHAVATARAAGCGPVVVVLGGGGITELLHELVPGDALQAVNMDWEEGMASSVRVAVKMAATRAPDAGAILFTVCDQPLVTADLLIALVREHRAGHDLVAAEYGGGLGVPALFARRFFGELLELEGDAGARRVLARHAAEARAIPFPGGIVDVDTSADVARLVGLADTHDDRARTVLMGATMMATAPAETEPTTRTAADDRQPLTLTINGATHELAVEPWTILLDLLRNDLGLVGTKKGCDHGQCGACTVLVDGLACNSCLLLAVMQDGREITTIEGIAAGDGLHPLQAAFIAHDAFQCGYCTPGQICSAVALIHEGRARTADEIREHMSGNLCRCAAYPGIVAAIADVLSQGGDRP